MSIGTATPRSNGTAAPRPEKSKLVAAWLGLFVEAGSVVELRALGCKKYPNTHSGYYDSEHLSSMAEHGAAISTIAEGVYFTPNPVRPDLLARSCNTTRGAKKGEGTSAGEVVRRRWLMIDVDPERPSGISSTDAEKAAARGVAEAVASHLAGLGWPAPVFCDSGNGWHLFYRADLPTDDGGLCARVLASLAKRFSADGAKVDRQTHDANRMAKVYGTLAAKGSHTADRPHRLSAIVSVPGCDDPRDPDRLALARVEVVPTELLELVAGPAPTKGPATSPRPGVRTDRRLKVGEWLRDRGVEFEEGDHEGGRKFVLAACPFNPDHKGTSAAVFQFASGATSFRCLHDSCSGRGWQDAKRAIGEPDDDHWDPPRTARDRCAPGPPPPSSSEDAAPVPGGNDRPIIPYLQGSAAFVADSVLARMAERMPRLFVWSGKLALVVDRERGQSPQIAVMQPETIREEISRYILMQAQNQKTGEWAEADPPASLAKAIYHRPIHQGVRHLDGVIEAPAMRADGSVIDRPGYDDASRLLYLPSADYPPPPPSPTRDDAMRACKSLLSLVEQFEFGEESHRMVWLASVLTIVARPAIAGPTPLFLFDAGLAGSGKSKLAKTACIIGTGRDPETRDICDDANEMRKRVTAILLEGPQVALFDNAANGGNVGCAALDRVLTSMYDSDRILGQSRTTGRMAIRVVWMVTGNNLTVTGDAHRRTLPCRLVPSMENPEERSGFAIPDLEAHARWHRGRLLVDALTVLRYHLASPPLAAELTPFGNYEDWSNVVRGAIYRLTGVDPWESRSSLESTAQQAAEVRYRLFSRLAWVPGIAEGKGLTAGGILKAIKEKRREDREMEALGDLLAELADERSLPSETKLGHILPKFKDQISDGMRLRKIYDKHQKASRWRLDITPRAEVAEVAEVYDPNSTCVDAPACVRECACETASRTPATSATPAPIDRGGRSRQSTGAVEHANGTIEEVI